MSFENNEARSFDCQRNQSNSLYMPRQSAFKGAEELVGYECSPASQETNRHLLPNFYAKDQTEFAKPGKDAYEPSLPESTDADSEEDSFESHFDAIDELSELFDSAPIEQNKVTSCAPFARPANPVVKDQQFYIPRCSAPTPVTTEAHFEQRESSSMNFSCRQVPQMKNMKRQTTLSPLVFM